MAYECGYFGGYSDVECLGDNVLGCGGGNYGGAQYGASPYGGVIPCNTVFSIVNPVQSNVVDYCRIVTSCGD